ncbi:MAG: hypothetical protein M1834_006821 [Cirrosporium novae-zelandiae]|nr:MAG: hypothetical protein M1834_006821 [Cirrosporium novae-zelandiae]
MKTPNILLKYFVEVNDVPEMGKGLTLLKDVSAGTCLIMERPIFTAIDLGMSEMDENLLKLLKGKLNGLTKGDGEDKQFGKAMQRAFLQLQNCRQDPREKINPIVGTWLTNNITISTGCIGNDFVLHKGVFEVTSRINHSCLPNASFFYDKDTGMAMIYAIKDLKAGDEIYISYNNQFATAFERQADLEERWRFVCRCKLCALPRSESKMIDRLMVEAEDIRTFLADEKKYLDTPLEYLSRARKLVDVCISIGITDKRICLGWFAAFRVTAFHGDMARASIFADLASRANALCEGSDAPRSWLLSDCVNDPSRHIELEGNVEFKGDDGKKRGLRWTTKINDFPKEWMESKTVDSLWGFDTPDMELGLEK